MDQLHLSTPRQGIHAHRMPGIDIATVDTVGTVVIAYGVSKYMDWPFLATAVGTFAVGVGVHHIFKINSPLHNKVMDVLGIKMDHAETDAATKDCTTGSRATQPQVWNSTSQSF